MSHNWWRLMSRDLIRFSYWFTSDTWLFLRMPKNDRSDNERCWSCLFANRIRSVREHSDQDEFGFPKNSIKFRFIRGWLRTKIKSVGKSLSAKYHKNKVIVMSHFKVILQHFCLNSDKLLLVTKWLIFDDVIYGLNDVF